MFALSPEKSNSVLSLLCSCLPVTKYISSKYRGTRRERINTKHRAGGEKKKTLSESLTAWSTQVADSQETDLIMLLVTMLCPYSGWHRCWQRPPLHSNQETKCRRAPQSPVGRSLANHLPGSGENQRRAQPWHTVPCHQADRACFPPRRLRSTKGRGEERSWPNW